MQASTSTLSSPTPARPITRGPKHHWFGYYDKLQLSASKEVVENGVTVGDECMVGHDAVLGNNVQIYPYKRIEPAAVIGHLDAPARVRQHLFGVGGGFLMTPLLIFIGVPPPVAVATPMAHPATTSPG